MTRDRASGSERSVVWNQGIRRMERPTQSFGCLVIGFSVPVFGAASGLRRISGHGRGMRHNIMLHKKCCIKVA